MEEKREIPTTPDHVHDYFGRTSVTNGHFHTFVGSEDVQQYVPGGHVHNYANETREADNHTHIMRGTSGLPIPVLLGHVDQLAGTTEMADNHAHTYDLYSGYQRAPRNVRRFRPFRTESVGEAKEAPAERRPRFRFPRREANSSSDQK